MDPSLLKQQEAFKKRLGAASISHPRPKKDAHKKSQVHAKAVKRSSKGATHGPPPPTFPKCECSKMDACLIVKLQVVYYCNSAASGEITRGLNNPHRVLKSVMDLLKERYTAKDYKRLSFNEILDQIKRQDLTVELSDWLVEALCSNPKIDFDLESQTYLFKPSLGLHVRTRRNF